MWRQGKVWFGLAAEARGKGQPLEADSHHFNNASNFGVISIFFYQQFKTLWRKAIGLLIFRCIIYFNKISIHPCSSFYCLVKMSSCYLSCYLFFLSYYFLLFVVVEKKLNFLRSSVLFQSPPKIFRRCLQKYGVVGDIKG